MKASRSTCRASSSPGNTITRDTVIRRELLLEEGQVYNSQLWEHSLLRLNQLDYFDPLKVDQDSGDPAGCRQWHGLTAAECEREGQELHRLEWRRQRPFRRIYRRQLPDQQLPRPRRNPHAANRFGDLQRNFTFGFTVPYVKNRPISLGFQVFTQKNQYNASKNPLSGSTDQNFAAAQQSFVQNYNQSRDGRKFSINYLIPRSFKRIGATYTLSRSNIQAFSSATTNLFQFLNFRHGTSGQSALNGIVTSQLSLSYSYSTVGNPIPSSQRQEPQPCSARVRSGRKCELGQSADGIQVFQAD